ncbi:hypothetical protein [Spiroplasma endosymbiont of Seladonia tumulorum]|uniref:hypothetical protein n=1 Tax=Spiroplasma endosymbiont of Seladonia tumulorum TaxID=3066321 RepID=UPI0030CB5085
MKNCEIIVCQQVTTMYHIFFQDFRRLEYYLLYLIVLSIIIALLITFVVNLNNLLVNHQKIKESQEKIN